VDRLGCISMGESIGAKVEDFVRKSRMVFRMATMPSSKEVWQLLKIIALLVIVLGFIGFVIRMLIQSLVGVLGR